MEKFDSANPAQGLLPVASPVDGNEPGSGLYYGGWVRTINRNRKQRKD